MKEHTMRYLALMLVATAAVVALVVTVRPHDRAARRPPAAIASTAALSPSPTTTTPARPAYQSGTATGAAHTDFGDVRVRVTVARGRIVHVVAVELPHGNAMDVQLSKPAATTLAREVLQAQSADVDVVSGATYTSTGYLNSLQAALDQLK
jgi:uncharacterized protein with FMN-binding domain